MDTASLLTGENAGYVDEKYRSWLESPASVEPAWRALFESMRDEPIDADDLAPPPPDRRSIFGGSAPAASAASSEEALRIARRQSAVVRFINAWRVRGHFMADLDPLRRRELRPHPELDLATWGLGDGDLDARVPTAPMYGMPEVATIREIRDRLRAAYAGTIGAEFMNIDDATQKRWVLEQLETLPSRIVLTKEQELRILRKLSDAENFERFLHTRFPGTKRFSLEGGETLVPLLDLLVEAAGQLGTRDIVMGMAHRGRLNVLVNTFEKPVSLIVSEFQDSRGNTQGSGDVKYHLGFSSDVTTLRGDHVHLSLTPNPSHLEVVNPVVEGRVRAWQDRTGDTAHVAALAVLLHGDAAFIGQGSVAETLQLAELDGYCTGGTIHIVVNNQIGFTTAPKESRSTPYATDMARMMGIPIFHVNGEDPRAVAAVTRIAVEWRQKFHRDVVIDMYCYRKHGHNEGDEPSFTQPLMYEEIRRRPTPRENYARRLVELGRVTKAEADAVFEESRAAMEAEAGLPAPEPGFEAAVVARDVPVVARVVPVATRSAKAGNKGRWKNLIDGRIDEEVPTGVARERLTDLLVRANTFPEGFHPHAKVRRLVAQRLEMARGERELDWSTAEQAAFASLVTDGHLVRLSGQDSARGTFSQRHAVWTDTENGAEWFSLANLDPGQRPFQAIDSNLSELGVLGFEYGYSLETPDGLVLWEAQFGDFANGAQVIIDQFIASGEQKWGRLSGLVMLLPHGFEGQGPEHSSARLERYLQLCAQGNIQVANFSTPANYFHALRRQCVRNVRKPLVIMTPKSLLRNPACASTLDELAEESSFRRVIADPRELDDAAVRRVVFCSGHVYYDLVAAQADHPDRDKVAIHRVELLYPFPAEDVRGLVDDLPADAEIVWCQEEPRNQGAWPVLSHWLRDALPEGRDVRYVGRPEAASPATGSHHRHEHEQEALVSDALTL